jgi:hypothetical protein
MVGRGLPMNVPMGRYAGAWLHCFCGRFRWSGWRFVTTTWDLGKRPAADLALRRLEVVAASSLLVAEDASCALDGDVLRSRVRCAVRGMDSASERPVRRAPT